MSGTEVVAVAAVVLLAVLAGAFVALLVVLARSLAELRRALDDFRDGSADLLDELATSTRHAAAQVDRVDRLVTAAEGIEERVEGVSRLAARTLSSPVVKAMAIGAGVSRAGERLRTGSDSGSRRRRRRRRKAS